jgi:hypothetical protein
MIDTKLSDDDAEFYLGAELAKAARNDRKQWEAERQQLLQAGKKSV